MCGHGVGFGEAAGLGVMGWVGETAPQSPDQSVLVGGTLLLGTVTSREHALHLSAPPDGHPGWLALGPWGPLGVSVSAAHCGPA